MTIWMIVEDEPDIRDVVSTMFQMWGVDGIAFCDGKEAVDWVDGVESGSVCFDLPSLALLDIRLPNLSGIEVAARLRRCPRLAWMSIVMMTAFRLSASQERQVLTLSGADLLMYKPLPLMPVLRRTLEMLVVR